MKGILFTLALATTATGMLLYDAPTLRNWPCAVLLWFMFVGIIWLLALCLSFIGWVWDACTAAQETYCEFEEPEDDAVIEGDIGPLVECDTAGTPTPPSEVMVHEYLWNPAQSAYELARVTPLSQYNLVGADPRFAQILSRTPAPPVIRGAPAAQRAAAPAPKEPESEFDEVERRLQAPAFRDRTNHGAPVDRPGREF